MYTAVRHAIVFARCSVRNTKRTHLILTQVFDGVARCLQENASTVIVVWCVTGRCVFYCEINNTFYSSKKLHW